MHLFDNTGEVGPGVACLRAVGICVVLNSVGGWLVLGPRRSRRARNTFEQLQRSIPFISPSNQTPSTSSTTAEAPHKGGFLVSSREWPRSPKAVPGPVCYCRQFEDCRKAIRHSRPRLTGALWRRARAWRTQRWRRWHVAAPPRRARAPAGVGGARARRRRRGGDVVAVGASPTGKRERKEKSK